MNSNLFDSWIQTYEYDLFSGSPKPLILTSKSSFFFTGVTITPPPPPFFTISLHVISALQPRGQDYHQCLRGEQGGFSLDFFFKWHTSKSLFTLFLQFAQTKIGYYNFRLKGCNDDESLNSVCLESMALNKTIRTSDFARWQVTRMGVVRDHSKILPKLREFDWQWRLWKKYLSYK